MAKGNKGLSPGEFTALIFVLALVFIVIVQILNWVARWIGVILFCVDVIGVIAIIVYVIRKRRRNRF